MRWFPHVTVAAVIEDNGKFLMVKECINEQIVYNQPAGHLEANETLLEAVVREVQEETACLFAPHALVGIYRMHINESDRTYLRACFSGKILAHDPAQALDKEIIETAWLDKAELQSIEKDLRSPLVMQCIEDYLAGQHCSLELIKDIGNV